MTRHQAAHSPPSQAFLATANRPRAFHVAFIREFAARGRSHCTGLQRPARSGDPCGRSGRRRCARIAGGALRSPGQSADPRVAAFQSRLARSPRPLGIECPQCAGQRPHGERGGGQQPAICRRWRPATFRRPPRAVTADLACACAPAHQCAWSLRPTRYGAGDWPPGDIRPAARRVGANALVPSHRHRACASRLAPSTRISRD